MEDHYRTLGVSRTASKEVIESTYQKFIKAVDPKYSVVIETWTIAFKVLSDQAKRTVYDVELEQYEARQKTLEPLETSTTASTDRFAFLNEGNATKNESLSSKNESEVKMKVNTSVDSNKSISSVPIKKAKKEDTIQEFEKQVCRTFVFIIIAIIPLILLATGWFESMAYSFEDSVAYPIQRMTSDSSDDLIGDIPYFTDKHFLDLYSKNPEKLASLEITIEEDYKKYLTAKCSKEKKKKSLEIDSALRFDKKKLQNAKDIALPSCELFNKYFDREEKYVSSLS